MRFFKKIAKSILDYFGYLGLKKNIPFLTFVKLALLTKKISNTKYRVLLGPFDDIKKIEETFNKIKSLDFENLEILKDV